MKDRRGFTLIELMIVVVIIGLLAAIAMPKFGATRERALLTRMMSDLRNLMQSQEAYLNEAQIYYGGVLPSGSLVYSPSEGVLVTILEATGGGWSATATSGQTTKKCAIYMGDAAPVAPATTEGRVMCEQ